MSSTSSTKDIVLEEPSPISDKLDTIIKLLEIDELPWYLRLKSLYEFLKASALNPAGLSHPSVSKLSALISSVSDKLAASIAPLFNIEEGKELEAKIDSILTESLGWLDAKGDVVRLFLAEILRKLQASVITHYQKFSISATGSVTSVNAMVQEKLAVVLDGKYASTAKLALAKLLAYAHYARTQAHEHIMNNVIVIQDASVSKTKAFLQTAQPIVQRAVLVSQPYVLQALEAGQPYLKASQPYYKPIVSKANVTISQLEANKSAAPYVARAKQACETVIEYCTPTTVPAIVTVSDELGQD